ncbi:MAG: type VII toxin-antitoxin system MntA family adenylyltransferase antitoxin [Longimicrobiales bacterium]
MQSARLTELLADLWRALDPERDILFAYLFGSMAKGHTGASSDVDVAVSLRNGEGVAARVDRALALEGSLEETLRRPVQVVVLDDAPLDLRHNVLRHGPIILTRDEPARHRVYVDHTRQYYDMEHARRIFARYMNRRIREATFGGGTGHGP